MTDYFQEATNYVIKNAGDDFAVDKRSIVDDEYFYCFVYHTKAFLETGDFSKMAVGQGPTFIVKRDNRIIPFGSGVSFENARAKLEQWLVVEERIKGRKPHFDPAKRYYIQITNVKNRSVIIDKLLKFQATYTIPEIVGDSIFRIPKKYDSKLLEKRLKELPADFRGIKSVLFLIDELLAADAGDFDLLEYHEKIFAKYASKATDEDLKPAW